LLSGRAQPCLAGRHTTLPFCLKHMVQAAGSLAESFPFGVA